MTYVRTGSPGYADVFGRPFWEDLDANPEGRGELRRADGARPGTGIPDPEVLVSGDWSGVQHVVDVGGGTGTLLAEILKSRPWLRGTLVDLPRAVAGSAEVFSKAGVADRVTAVAQNFFEPLPTGGDLYLLMKVLNDWPDRGCPGDPAMLRRGGAAERSGRGDGRGRAGRNAARAGDRDGAGWRHQPRHGALHGAGESGGAGGGGIRSAAERSVRGRAEAAPQIALVELERALRVGFPVALDARAAGGAVFEACAERDEQRNEVVDGRVGQGDRRRGALVIEQGVDVSAGQRFGGPVIELADPAWRRLLRAASTVEWLRSCA